MPKYLIGSFRGLTMRTLCTKTSILEKNGAPGGGGPPGSCAAARRDRTPSPPHNNSAVAKGAKNLAAIDRAYTESPYYGAPRMTARLRRQGCAVNHKRVERLMRLMGLQAAGSSRFASRPDKAHRIYPY